MKCIYAIKYKYHNRILLSMEKSKQDFFHIQDYGYPTTKSKMDRITDIFQI